MLARNERSAQYWRIENRVSSIETQAQGMMAWTWFE